MLLKNLKVQHYKSLDSVDVTFSPDITVIVGPNGVGKSNFVDVLRFLRDAVTEDLEHAVTKREGIQRILQTYKTKPYKVGFQLEIGAATDIELNNFGNYQLQIRSVGSSDYAVEFEYVDVHNDELGLGAVTYSSSFERDKHGNGQRTVTGNTNKPPKMVSDFKGLASDQVYVGLKHEGETIGSFVAHTLRELSFCTIYPNTLKKPAIPDRDTSLKESGDNWASVIKAMKRSPKGREALERIFEAMQTVIPSFQEVTIKTVGSYLVPWFHFSNDDGTTSTFDPVQLSDGTLRLFGMLLAAYQLPRPSLLVIEEPEQTIYPGALSVLADVFKEISKTTQVLITTHSPHLVQCFAPEQIRVATMKDGITQIRPIHPMQMEAVKEGLLSLEEFMTGEGLRPDDAPEEAQA